ncbi:hypothetical protein FPV67DRAFT_80607 [Lyophyllum atratum]|nr:hypothetical protein FPV67DRAFT_80607 [Lyophyllum atratum]
MVRRIASQVHQQVSRLMRGDYIKQQPCMVPSRSRPSPTSSSTQSTTFTDCLRPGNKDSPNIPPQAIRPQTLAYCLLGGQNPPPILP